MGWTQVRAAGFNAWGQAALVPSSRPHNSQDNLRTWDEPDDLESFTQVQGSVAKDVRNIESFLSYTLSKRNFANILVTPVPAPCLHGFRQPPPRRVLRSMESHHPSRERCTPCRSVPPTG
jgi:hypothetical protein